MLPLTIFWCRFLFVPWDRIVGLCQPYYDYTATLSATPPNFGRKIGEQLKLLGLSALCKFGRKEEQLSGLWDQITPLYLVCFSWVFF